MKRGFTLIELLAVILILGIIAVIAVPNINKMVKNSNKKSWEASASNLVKAAENYYSLCKEDDKCQLLGLAIIKNGKIVLKHEGEILTIAELKKLFELKGKLPELEKISYYGVDQYGTAAVYFSTTDEYYCSHAGKVPKCGTCAETKNFEFSFDYTGDSQEFKVICEGEYKVELWGAEGGRSSSSIQATGGGYTSGIIKLNKNEKLYVYVGEHPTYNSGSCYNTNPNIAFNGTTIGTCSGGGGATDIRLSENTWNNTTSLRSRIMVAGGGGGAYYSATSGAAGGLTAYSGGHNNPQGYTPSGGSGATQTTGGSFGIGTNGTSSGGGGYYGGSGGYAQNAGGGSSFISGHTGCNAINASGAHTNQPNHFSGNTFQNTIMIDGLGYNWTNVKGGLVKMPNPRGAGLIAGNSGNGFAKITYVGN